MFAFFFYFNSQSCSALTYNTKNARHETGAKFAVTPPASEMIMNAHLQ